MCSYSTLIVTLTLAAISFNRISADQQYSHQRSQAFGVADTDHGEGMFYAGNDLNENERRVKRKAGQSRSRGHQQRGRPNNGRDDNENEISISDPPPCEREGLVLIEESVTYYLKCSRNPDTGLFSQTIYICPSSMYYATGDTSACIPPPDCSQCP